MVTGESRWLKQKGLSDMEGEKINKKAVKLRDGNRVDWRQNLGAQSGPRPASSFGVIDMPRSPPRHTPSAPWVPHPSRPSIIKILNVQDLGFKLAWESN